MNRPSLPRLLLAAVLGVVAVPPLHAEPRSGYEYILPETRALQDDDFENPGMIAVERGKALFNRSLTSDGKPCAACHGEDGADLEPASIARYPLADGETGVITTLQDRIGACARRASNDRPADEPQRVALLTFVRHLARGEPVAVDTAGLDELLAQGEELFSTRYGLIDMSCRHCHDFYAGQMIRGQHISQGMTNGFPAYRLGTGDITTLQQRIQQCLELMRAEPFPTGSRELRLLELYMTSRSNGLPIETPAVRY